MAAHARLKNEFTEDEKYHNLMRWLISPYDDKVHKRLTVRETRTNVQYYVLRLTKVRRYQWNSITIAQLSQLMRLWHFSSAVILFLKNAHAQPSSGARCPMFDRTLRLLPYFM